MRKLLICDKNGSASAKLSRYLTQSGYLVENAQNGAEARERIRRGNVDLLIIDTELPKSDGIKFLQEIREKNSFPILVLTGKSGEMDKIRALNAGADDYIMKPCSMPELLARVKAQLRRYTQFGSLAQEMQHIYRVDGLEIDDDTRNVTVDGREVRLTPIEYKILRMLAQERGRVYSIEQIYETIWNMDAVGADNTIAVHIRHIREKIENNPKNPKYLKVVWGTGYKVG